jgi:hypothetical protein
MKQMKERGRQEGRKNEEEELTISSNFRNVSSSHMD